MGTARARMAWLACWFMLTLCHDALTLLLFVLAVGSRIGRAFEWSLAAREPATVRAQLLDILSLYHGQDLFLFHLRDDFDFEFPHTVSQIEVGSLQSELVFRVVYVAAEVEDDSLSSRTRLVNTSKALSNLGHQHVQATHLAIDSTQHLLLSLVVHMLSSSRRVHTSGLAVSHDRVTRYFACSAAPLSMPVTRTVGGSESKLFNSVCFL